MNIIKGKKKKTLRTKSHLLIIVISIQAFLRKINNKLTHPNAKL